MSTNELKKYLKRVYELEKSLYMQSCVYNTISQRIQRLRTSINVNYKQYDIDTRDGWVGFVVIPLGVIIGGLIGCFYQGFHSGILLSIGRGILAGVIIAVAIVVIQYACRSVIYKEKCDEIDRINQSRYNEACELQNRQYKQANGLQNQLSKMKEKYWETKDILDTYYSKNIIYFKYRNLIAISSIFEYIDSGRCVCLEGYEGAYNIFESELRMNLIVTRLDEISSKLDRIIDNQRLLYEAVLESNNQVNKLNNNIKKSIGTIEKNVEISNYYNRISAQNTEFIKWISLLNS